MGTSILGTINVLVEGSDDKVLILTHGFGADQFAWQQILPYFTRHYIAILYDFVYVGSVNPDHFNFCRYTTLDAYVNNLLDILDIVHVTHCAFINHSISAMIRMLVAIYQPKLFTKLILIDASPK